FFFQAEDGIRDFHVTGVQTCALPISGAAPARESPTMKYTRITIRTANSGTTIGIHLTKPSPSRSRNSPARVSAVRSGNRLADVRAGRDEVAQALSGLRGRIVFPIVEVESIICLRRSIT